LDNTRRKSSVRYFIVVRSLNTVVKISPMKYVSKDLLYKF